VAGFLAWARYRPAECFELLRRLAPSR